MLRRTYVMDEARVEWIDKFAEITEMEKSQIVEVVFIVASGRMERAWEAAGRPRGAKAVHAILQAQYEESIKMGSARRRS
jgi:hypothetical protein